MIHENKSVISIFMKYFFKSLWKIPVSEKMKTKLYLQCWNEIHHTFHKPWKTAKLSTAEPVTHTFSILLCLFWATGMQPKCRQPWQTITPVALLLCRSFSSTITGNRLTPLHIPKASFENRCLTPGVYQLPKSSKSKLSNAQSP